MEADKTLEHSVITHLAERGHTPITLEFTGMGIQAADIISITTSEYINEFEVKRSRSDFLADFRNKPGKHKNMANRSDVIIKGNYVWYPSANNFWFVSPEDVINPIEIPEYAGLIYVKGTIVKVVKKAPRLHKHKATMNFYKGVAHNLTNKMIYGCSYMNFRRKINAE